MLEYDYPLFRPPAEANNLILQVTLGCSYNNCNFCSMYKTKSYEVKDLENIFSDIENLAIRYPDTKRIFLADGDALSLPSEQLLTILKKLQETFPKLGRVSTYASAQNILGKSNKELELLCKNKLNLFYYGIETGSDTLLKKLTKGVNQEEIITSINRATEAGVKVSATVILGIGGDKYSDLHVKETAKVINATKVNYLSTLQLGLEEDAKDNFYKHFDDFSMMNDEEVLDEQKRFLEALNPSNKVIFRSNHASNALHLAGTLSKDKDRLIQELQTAIHVGKSAFVPEVLRGF